MNTSTSTSVWWTGCLRKWRARAMLMRPRISSPRCHLSRGHRHRCGYCGPVADHTAKRILRAFCGPWAAGELRGKRDAGVQTDSGFGGCRGALEPTDRPGLERLFALLRPPTPLRWTGCAKREATAYRCGKQRRNPPATSAVPRLMSCTHTAGADRPHCALVPWPRTHRHPLFGAVGT